MSGRISHYSMKDFIVQSPNIYLQSPNVEIGVPNAVVGETGNFFVGGDAGMEKDVTIMGTSWTIFEMQHHALISKVQDQQDQLKKQEDRIATLEEKLEHMISGIVLLEAQLISKNRTLETQLQGKNGMMESVISD